MSLALLFGCGLLMVLQATINSSFSQVVGLPVFTVVFSATQLLFALPLLFFANSGFDRLAQASWWHHSGGALGVILLTGIAYGITCEGAFTAQVCLLLGQLLMGLMIDQFGMFGVEPRAISWSRLVSLLLVLAAVALQKVVK